MCVSYLSPSFARISFHSRNSCRVNENKPLLVEMRDWESVSLMLRLLISSSFVVLASSWNAFAFHPACTSRLSLPNKYCSQSWNAKRFRHHLLTLRTKPSDDVDDDDVDNLFFDDFGGDFVGSDGPASSSSSFSSSLSERIQEQKLGDERTSAKLAKNWKTGNWGVRGFILDSSDPLRESMADATASAENADVGGGSAPRLGGGSDMSSSNADAMEIPPIHVSTIVADQSHMYDEGYESEKIDKIVVGRTDGSVLIVKMGTAYMTQFTAVPKLRLTDSSSWDSNNDASSASADQDTASSDGPSVRVETELMNSEDVQKSLGDVVGDIGGGDEVNNMQYPMEDPFDALYGAGNANAGQEPMQGQAMEATPFEILHQFSAHENEPITALLFINDIVFSAAGHSGEIRTWSMPEEDGNNSEAKMIPGKTLSDAHSDLIVALKVLSSSPDSVEPDLLLSASRDGSFALWDLNSGDLVTRCQMLTEASEPESIMCADVDASGVDGDVIYFGLNSGYVNCYFVNDVIIGASAGGICPMPSSRFQAHDGVGGVTAILAAGQGTSMSNNLQQQARPTSILLTGGADGLVKQWEMMSRKLPPSEGREEQGMNTPSFQLEHWPRLPTQRMKRRAHLFQAFSGAAINALAQIEPSKFLSAGADGTVRIWSPSEGKELYRMDGFTDLISSLVLAKDALVTNGMENMVCLHDFGVDIDEAENGYELEW